MSAIPNSIKSKLSGLLRLFRFELPFTAGLCAVLGQLLALGTLPTIVEIILGFLSVFFISAAALILNDYFDIESDRINAPDRPLPSGLVTKQDVILLTAGVTLLGLITGFLISWAAVLVIMVVWIVGFLYNWRFKKVFLLGNLMVSLSVGMTFIFGGVSVNRPFSPLVWFFAAWVFFINLGEEIAADAMDIDGDRKAGSRSIALVLGRDKALRISAAIFLTVIAASSLPFILGWLGWIYLLPFILTDAVMFYCLIKLLQTDDEKGRIYIRWIYMSGMVTLIIIIILRLILGI